MKRFEHLDLVILSAVIAALFYWTVDTNPFLVFVIAFAVTMLLRWLTGIAPSEEKEAIVIRRGSTIRVDELGPGVAEMIRGAGGKIRKAKSGTPIFVELPEDVQSVPDGIYTIYTSAAMGAVRLEPARGRAGTTKMVHQER